MDMIARVRTELEDWDMKSGVVGVCHDVTVDIGGVAVKAHLFMMEHVNVDLILGRPWGHSARAQFTNENDGSYTVKLKSPDGRRLVEFIAVPAEHERNREFARNVFEGRHLKF